MLLLFTKNLKAGAARNLVKFWASRTTKPRETRKLSRNLSTFHIRHTHQPTKKNYYFRV